MRVCKNAKPSGVPCPGGVSKLVECSIDGSTRCLRDCMRGCASYEVKTASESATTPFSTGQPGSAQGAFGRNVPSAKSIMTTGKPCGRPLCGGGR